MTHYMNQAAKDWLLRALEVIHQEFPAEAGNAEALQHALYEEIKALPVIDAGDDEAEAALERILDPDKYGDVTAEEACRAGERDEATIRARLRAARASHTPEEIERAWAMLGKIRSSLCLALGPPCNCWACESAAPAIAAVLPPRPEPAAKPKDTQG